MNKPYIRNVCQVFFFGNKQHNAVKEKIPKKGIPEHFRKIYCISMPMFPWQGIKISKLSAGKFRLFSKLGNLYLHLPVDADLEHYLWIVEIQVLFSKPKGLFPFRARILIVKHRTSCGWRVIASFSVTSWGAVLSKNSRISLWKNRK